MAADVAPTATAALPAGPHLPRIKTKGNARGAEQDESPVSPASRAFLHPSFNLVICCAVEFRDKMELPALQEHLQQSLGRHPRFRSRVVYRNRVARWVSVALNIAEHVTEGAMSAEEQAHPLSAVESYMARMLEAPSLDAAKPLWQAHLIHPARPNSASTCVFIIHHSLGDGISLMSLLLASARQAQNPTLLPTLPGAKPRAQAVKGRGAGQGTAALGDAGARTQPGATGGMQTEASCETLDTMAVQADELFKHQRRGGAGEGQAAATGGAAEVANEGKSWRSRRRGSGLAVEVARNSLVHITRFNLQLIRGDHKTAIKATSRLNHKQKSVAFSEEISLKDIAAIREAMGGTVNDVMLTALSLALEQFLLTGRSEGHTQKLPQRPRVSAVGVVNLRHSPGLQELSAMMDESISLAPWGNKIGAFIIPLPLMRNDFASTGAEARARHALGTLRSIAKMNNSKKKSAEALYSYWAGQMILALAGSEGAAFMLRHMGRNTTLAISNMHGPVEQISLAGNPITSISPTAPPPAQALVCHFQSYDGRIKAVLTGSRDKFPNLPALAYLFAEACRELHRHALNMY